MPESKMPLRIAVEGCGHGTLDAIYASVQQSCQINDWDGVDLLIIGGDFQAVRNRQDLNVTAMPARYRRMGDFHQYYHGKKTAPYLTIFIGGNHEASNHLFELNYGGWVAPNIYYLGVANVIQIGSLKIGGLSGIWHKHDYRKPHFERLPYTSGTMRSIYHVREIDARKLLAYRSQIDVGLSHDWPQGIEWLGDHKSLFRAKPFFKSDAESGELGNVAARRIMNRLRPPYWFSAHMHWRYTAFVNHEEKDEKTSEGNSKTATSELKRIQHSTSHQDSESSSPASHKQALPVRNGDQGAVSAWNNFHVEAKKTETEIDSKLAKDAAQRMKEVESTGLPLQANYIFEETYKQVQVDGIKRDTVDGQNPSGKSSQNKEGAGIPQFDGVCFSLPQKRHREPSPSEAAMNQPLIGENEDSTAVPQLDGASPQRNQVVNPDAIDIDMSDSEEDIASSNPSKPSDSQGASATLPGSETATAPTTSDNVSHDLGDSSSAGQAKVSEEMRAKLAALSNTFVKPEAIEVTPALPHPDTITNKQTRFLALSKCESGKQFLQLLEVEPISGGETVVERPVKLKYDPEWLAILRVFAPELELGGSPNDRIAQHRGDTYYRDRILEEEKWVQENIAEKGLLEIPENFERTASQDDDSVDNDSMPRELTNSQTSRFCELIGIENLFDIDEDERDRRMAEGPSKEAAYNEQRTHRGRGNGGRGRGGCQRGGRRGQGRGRNRW